MGHDDRRATSSTEGPTPTLRRVGGSLGGTAPADPGDVARQLVAGLGSGAGDAVFGTLNDLLLVVGPDGTVEYANPAAAVLLGESRDRIVGRSIAQLIHPDDVSRALEAAARVGSPAASVGVAAPIRVAHATAGWRWLDLASGTIGTGAPRGARYSIVTGRLNDDQHIFEDVIALIAGGSPLPEVVETLPRLAAWRLPDIPFTVACTSGTGRHVAGHPAATELLRAALADRPWLDGLPADGGPDHGRVADLGLAARSVGIRHGLATWVAARVWSQHGDADAIVLATTNPDTAPASVVGERVRRMAGVARLVVEWSAQRDALDHSARIDPLTGALSRRATLVGLAEALDRNQLQPEPVAALACDLDGFTAASATLGHAAGDAALAAAFGRLQEVAGRAAIGRLGGDSFLVIVRGPDARVAAEALATRAVEAMRAPLEVDDRSVVCGLSVGIAVSDGREHPPTSADGLLARAEAALRLARSGGGNRHVTTTV